MTLTIGDEALQIIRGSDPHSFADQARREGQNAPERIAWLSALLDAAKAEDARMRIRLGSAEDRVDELEASAEQLVTRAQSAFEQRDQAFAAVERRDGRVEGLQMAIGLQAASLRGAAQPGEAT